ncbi:MAG: MerR family transcriptional regulator [Candidatus Sumerlaeia bacterium]|nr:MerR family transcriptional regulator [Candidatus Sumerlaeia bacterium]
MAPATSYPKKLFYRIQEVANIVGVEPYVLRYWETKFPMLAPEKDGSDQRRYRQKDIDLLLRIRHLLYEEKYTIAGAVEKLKDEQRGGARRRKDEDDQPAAGADLFTIEELPPGVDSATDSFGKPATGELDEDQLRALRRVREELGLLKREVENWRDELA